MYGRDKTMVWKKERSRIKIVEMDNLRGLLGVRRMNIALEEWGGGRFACDQACYLIAVFLFPLLDAC